MNLKEVFTKSMNNSERKVGSSPKSRKSNKTSPVDYSLTFGMKDGPVEQGDGGDNKTSDQNFSKLA